MKRKKRLENPNFNFDDFKWCIENDFQVYPKVNKYGKFHIAIRPGGISTQGRNSYMKNGVELTSKEKLGNLEFKTIHDLADYLPVVYKNLRKKYGK